MHFEWYLNNKFLLNAYGRYFWYLQINRATQILAAYADGKFAGIYEDTTKEQLAHYLKSNTPDGEIIFLAADPDCKIKGIGTALLNALEEKEVILEMPKGKVPLKCFVYSKVI